jgi:hypothetical protein
MERSSQITDIATWRHKDTRSPAYRQAGKVTVFLVSHSCEL